MAHTYDLHRVYYANGLHMGLNQPRKSYVEFSLGDSLKSFTDWVNGTQKGIGESINKVGENTGNFVTDASRNTAEQASGIGKSVFQFGGYLPFALIGAGALVLIVLLKK
jgi:hypothetical protein